MSNRTLAIWATAIAAGAIALSARRPQRRRGHQDRHQDRGRRRG